MFKQILSKIKRKREMRLERQSKETKIRKAEKFNVTFEVQKRRKGRRKSLFLHIQN
jgi:hypothetical protein